MFIEIDYFIDELLVDGFDLITRNGNEVGLNRLKWIK